MSNDAPEVFNWVLTATKLPSADEYTFATRSPEGGFREVIHMGHDDYTLTKVDEFGSMKGVPFDENVIFIAFLQGDEKGENFQEWEQQRFIIADVEIIGHMDGEVRLYFANGETHDRECEYLCSTYTPKRFAEAFLGDD